MKVILLISFLLQQSCTAESKHHHNLRRFNKYHREHRNGRSLIAIDYEEEKSWLEKHIGEIQERSMDNYALRKWQPFLQKMMQKKKEVVDQEKSTLMEALHQASVESENQSGDLLNNLAQSDASAITVQSEELQSDANLGQQEIKQEKQEVKQELQTEVKQVQNKEIQQEKQELIVSSQKVNSMENLQNLNQQEKQKLLVKKIIEKNLAQKRLQEQKKQTQMILQKNKELQNKIAEQKKAQQKLLEQKLAKEKLEKEKIEKQKIEEEKLLREKLELEQLHQEKLEQEKLQLINQQKQKVQLQNSQQKVSLTKSESKPVQSEEKQEQPIEEAKKVPQKQIGQLLALQQLDKKRQINNLIAEMNHQWNSFCQTLNIEKWEQAQTLLTQLRNKGYKKEDLVANTEKIYRDSFQFQDTSQNDFAADQLQLLESAQFNLNNNPTNRILLNKFVQTAHEVASSLKNKYNDYWTDPAIKASQEGLKQVIVSENE